MPPFTTTYRTAIAAAALAALATASAPAQLSVQIDARWTFQTDAAHPGQTIRAALQVTVQDTFHVNSNEPLEEYLIPTTLAVTPPDGFTVRRVVYPEAHEIQLAFSEVPMAVFENEFVIGVELEVGAEVAPGEYQVAAELEYQACNDRFCLAPDAVALEETVRVVPADAPLAETQDWPGEGIDFSGPAEGPGAATPGGADSTVAATNEDCDVLAELEGFAIAGTAGGWMSVDDFLQFVDAAETGATQKGLFEGKGILAIVVLIIVGGVLLNLTPCVLPLIPINLAIIGAGAQAGSKLRGFALGGTYGLAMALVYGILGLIVILTASTFGQINSTIWFNVAIAALFVILALAMFDVIAIDFTKYQSKLDVSRTAKTGTFALAFFMGAVTALLAGACVAPVVIQVIVYSSDMYNTTESTFTRTVALILPFLLGVGLALPWPIAGAGIGCLPKPGVWMVRVKQALGVFILLFAGYYAYLAWGIYRGGAHDLEEGWTASLCEGFATARAENKPVFIDMWATWCKNCIVMDETTFRDDQVVARLEGYVKVKFQAEKTDVSPARDLLERFNGAGLPTYAILRPNAEPAESP